MTQWNGNVTFTVITHRPPGSKPLPCQHHWMPLIQAEIRYRPPTEDPGMSTIAPCWSVAPYGSGGSQIGWVCDRCGEERILWPRMRAIDCPGDDSEPVPPQD